MGFFSSENSIKKWIKKFEFYLVFAHGVVRPKLTVVHVWVLKTFVLSWKIKWQMCGAWSSLVSFPRPTPRRWLLKSGGEPIYPIVNATARFWAQQITFTGCSLLQRLLVTGKGSCKDGGIPPFSLLSNVQQHWQSHRGKGTLSTPFSIYQYIWKPRWQVFTLLQASALLL